MAALDLRPLSLGEILDRTFTLYRRNFLLFLGISAIPQLLILAVNLAQLLLLGRSAAVAGALARNVAITLIFTLALIVLYVLTYLVLQGGTIFAVTDLYLGRTTSISASLRRVWGELGSLFGVGFLNGLAIMAATVLLIIPGIYVFCRLLVCVPTALIENYSPRESLSRSWTLTQGSAGRAFVIILLYFVLVFAAVMLLVSPFSALIAFAGPKNPEMMRFWSILANVGNAVATTLVSPILLIATSVFYFDLRVRKEAFDLQFMMDPNSERIAGPSLRIPSILS